LRIWERAYFGRGQGWQFGYARYVLGFEGLQLKALICGGVFLILLIKEKLLMFVRVGLASMLLLATLTLLMAIRVVPTLRAGEGQPEVSSFPRLEILTPLFLSGI